VKKNGIGVIQSEDKIFAIERNLPPANRSTLEDACGFPALDHAIGISVRVEYPLESSIIQALQMNLKPFDWLKVMARHTTEDRKTIHLK
jgi:hypothetical protein